MLRRPMIAVAHTPEIRATTTTSCREQAQQLATVFCAVEWYDCTNPILIFRAPAAKATTRSQPLTGRIGIPRRAP
jgi:hypothetical protein